MGYVDGILKGASGAVLLVLVSRSVFEYSTSRGSGEVTRSSEVFRKTTDVDSSDQVSELGNVLSSRIKFEAFGKRLRRGIMGRPERPLLQDGSPERELAFWLRDLRNKSGMTYDQLARQTEYSISTLQEAAAGRRLPTLSVTLAIVRACGAV